MKKFHIETDEYIEARKIDKKAGGLTSNADNIIEKYADIILNRETASSIVSSTQWRVWDTIDHAFELWKLWNRAADDHNDAPSSFPITSTYG